MSEAPTFTKRDQAFVVDVIYDFLLSIDAPQELTQYMQHFGARDGLAHGLVGLATRYTLNQEEAFHEQVAIEANLLDKLLTSYIFKLTMACQKIIRHYPKSVQSNFASPNLKNILIGFYQDLSEDPEYLDSPERPRILDGNMLLCAVLNLMWDTCPLHLKDKVNALHAALPGREMSDILKQIVAHRSYPMLTSLSASGIDSLCLHEVLTHKQDVIHMITRIFKTQGPDLYFSYDEPCKPYYAVRYLDDPLLINQFENGKMLVQFPNIITLLTMPTMLITQESNGKIMLDILATLEQSQCMVISQHTYAMLVKPARKTGDFLIYAPCSGSIQASTIQQVAQLVTKDLVDVDRLMAVSIEIYTDQVDSLIKMIDIEIPDLVYQFSKIKLREPHMFFADVQEAEMPTPTPVIHRGDGSILISDALNFFMLDPAIPKFHLPPIVMSIANEITDTPEESRVFMEYLVEFYRHNDLNCNNDFKVLPVDLIIYLYGMMQFHEGLASDSLGATIVDIYENSPPEQRNQVCDIVARYIKAHPSYNGVTAMAMDNEELSCQVVTGVLLEDYDYAHSCYRYSDHGVQDVGALLGNILNALGHLQL